MSGKNSGNEPKPGLPELSDRRLKEVNRRLQRIRQNLSCLLECLKKTAENLQTVHEGYSKLLEIRKKTETHLVKAAGPQKGEKNNPGDSEKEPSRPTCPERDNDPLYGAAVALVASSRFVSNKFLMERLSIGFERSVKLIKRMKAEGIFDLVHL